MDCPLLILKDSYIYLIKIIFWVHLLLKVTDKAADCRSDVSLLQFEPVHIYSICLFFALSQQHHGCNFFILNTVFAFYYQTFCVTSNFPSADI